MELDVSDTRPVLIDFMSRRLQRAALLVSVCKDMLLKCALLCADIT
jgi:hypothetical protein